jgi:sodium/hydrogen antiporter
VEWYIIAGVLLVGVALAASFVRELPLTLAVIYLGAGIALGPWGAGLITVHPMSDAATIERLAEVAIVISLFGAGLRLRVPIRDRLWLVPVRLAFLSMFVTVGLIALLGWWLLGLPLGVAVLLGAILAPTDPVLAAEVQVDDPWDRDRLRFGLTAEAGMNDGAAFPFVVLGLGLLSLHELGNGGIRWAAWDLIAAPLGGTILGGLIATVIARLVLTLRRRYGHGVGLDGFLVLGVAALIYGTSLLLHVSGFLAAFAGGLALRRIERESGGAEAPPELMDDAAATDEVQAPAHLAHALLDRNEQLERVGELGLVVLTGVMLADAEISWTTVGIALAVLTIIRPLVVLTSLLRADIGVTQRRLTAWFGLRGIGSIYYLAFALHRGVTGEDGDLLQSATLLTVALSIVVHGASSRPLLTRYRRKAAPLRASARV